MAAATRKTYRRTSRGQVGCRRAKTATPTGAACTVSQARSRCVCSPCLCARTIGAGQRVTTARFRQVRDDRQRPFSASARLGSRLRPSSAAESSRLDLMTEVRVSAPCSLCILRRDMTDPLSALGRSHQAQFFEVQNCVSHRRYRARAVRSPGQVARGVLVAAAHHGQPPAHRGPVQSGEGDQKERGGEEGQGQEKVKITLVALRMHSHLCALFFFIVSPRKTSLPCRPKRHYRYVTTGRASKTGSTQ